MPSGILVKDADGDLAVGEHVATDDAVANGDWVTGSNLGRRLEEAAGFEVVHNFVALCVSIRID